MKLDKRKWFIIICIALIIIILLILLLTSIGGKKAIKTPDLPVKAYSRREGRTVRVTLFKPDDGNYEWNLTDAELSNLFIRTRDRSKKQIFIVSARESEIIENLTFKLQNKNDKKESIYNLTLYFEADGKSNLKFYDANGSKSEKSVRGKIGDSDYKIYNDGLNLFFELSQKPDVDNKWQIKVNGDENDITVAGPTTGDNSIIISFSRAALIETEMDGADASEEKPAEKLFSVDVFSEILLKNVNFKVKIDGNDYVSLISHEITDYVIPVVVDEKEKENFSEKNGEIKLPANAVKISYGSTKVYASTDDNEGKEIPEVSFYIDGNLFEYDFTDEEIDVNAFLWRFVDEKTKKTEFEINSLKVTYYEIGGGDSIAMWTNDVRKNALYCEGIGAEEAKKIIGEIG